MIDRQIILVASGVCFAVSCGPSDKYLSADNDKDGYSVALDCDDNNPDVHPNATEVCNGLDDNCDTFIDDADPQLVSENAWYRDSDGDGYGFEGSEVYGCQPPSGYVANKEDCNDSQPTVNPDGVEVCNGMDDNCDGDIDDSPEDGTQWYLDADGDGYGVPGETILACEQPFAYADNDQDCDDFDSDIFPDAPEVCDEIDNNCSGYIDSEDPNVDLSSGFWFYPDVDGDGFGSTASGSWGCDIPSGFVDNNQDCDDGNAAINPSASEICDGLDNDCQPQTTENGMVSQQTLNGWSDVTAIFSNGSQNQIAITQPTELLMCPGQYDVAFDVEADLSIDATADGVVLSSSHHRLFEVSQNAILDVERIGIDGSRGAVGCDQGQVIMRDGRYHDMFDPLDSLFSFTNCDVTLSTLQIENNIVSAVNPILEAHLSTLSLNEVHLTDNINGQGSTGIILNQSSASMIDSTVTGQNGGLHRGMLLSDSSLDCVANGSSIAGIFDTIAGAAESQTVALLGSSTFSSVGCEFGGLVTNVDDVDAKIIAGEFSYGPLQAQDISCDPAGCSGTLDLQSASASTSTSPARFGFTGNVYDVSGNPTSLSVEVPVDASGPCDTELAIWTRSTPISPWTLKWAETQSLLLGTSVTFSPSGLMLKDAEQVGIGFAWACDFNVSMSIFETGIGLSGSLGYSGKRLSTASFSGQSLSNVTLIENSDFRQMSHSIELWGP